MSDNRTPMGGTTSEGTTAMRDPNRALHGGGAATAPTIRAAAGRDTARLLSMLVILQVLAVTTAKITAARIRRVDPKADDGLTTVEWVVLLVIVAGGAAVVGKLIYSWITGKAKSVTSQ
jgi:hypothetical protein